MDKVNNKLFTVSGVISSTKFYWHHPYSGQKGINDLLDVGGFIPLPIPTLPTPSTANEAARSNLLRFFASQEGRKQLGRSMFYFRHSSLLFPLHVRRG
jgi:hypothetical protein